MNDMATAIAGTGWTTPIAFADWPTADPLHHPNEPNPQEDLVGVVGVDTDHVLPTHSWPAGTFASFHAYPYYPDFLRYQMNYQHFRIDGHADPYAAYLHALKVHFRGRMPLMITEFGVPSSLGSAHTGTLGRSQGDHSEAQAMRMDARILLEMRQLGLSGGFIFEWTDEWYKQTGPARLRQPGAVARGGPGAERAHPVGHGRAERPVLASGAADRAPLPRHQRHHPRHRPHHDRRDRAGPVS